MSTDTLIIDSPWHRLRWTLPSALLIGIVALWAIAYFTGKTDDRLPEPPAVEAQIIELPSPVASRPPAERKVPPVQPPQPLKPGIDKIPTPIREKPPTPAATPPMPAAPIAPPNPPKVPAKEAPPLASTGMTGNSGAQAILKPMPQIPDELRQDALSATAIARFHVAADGTATVELVNPTPNPRLNRLLLDTLKNWRFFPSMKDGKPVASTQEISIKIDVK
jgi:protein TonB